MRLLLAVVAGVVIANVVFLLVGFVGDALYPTPPELLDPQTPEETAARVEGAKAGGLALVVVGSALGGLAGGVVAGMVARGRAIAVAVVVGRCSRCGVCIPSKSSTPRGSGFPSDWSSVFRCSLFLAVWQRPAFGMLVQIADRAAYSLAWTARPCGP